MNRIDLANARWTCEPAGDLSQVPANLRGKTLEARIPGCIHSDLIRARAIGRPDLGFNEESCQWIGRTDWRYRCTAAVNAAMLANERVDVVFDGLDTIATIDINGRQAGEAMNMHHVHRFDVKRLLHEGDNELVIDLRGPVTYVEQQARFLGPRPVNGDWTPYSYMRKMASNFQWDWGPRVATCDIWRGASLEAWSGARIASIRPVIVYASTDRAEVRVEVACEFASGSSEALECTATLSIAQQQETEARPIATDSARNADPHRTLRLIVHEPALWWPRDCGEQPLHDLHVKVSRDGRLVDERRLRIGLRETRLLTQPDQHGEAFTIAVNGSAVFCKGANWIPEGLFPEDQSPERIRRRVQQAADANMNMLRVWGGGTYEQDVFYEACDELGIMVWQDFMFACATYPEDDPYPELIEREAREAVTRLCAHPSIVLWCGGNENILGYESWGWKQRMPHDQKWGERYFLEDLPRIVNELDPSRPYWPDSPYSGSRAVHPNDPDRGDRHTWDAKVEGYRDIVPRFCSEFGHQSPPCWATMRNAWGEDQLRLDSRAMEHRQRAAGGGGGGNEVWYGPKVMGGRFREPAPPDDFDEWLYQAHLLQARAISTGIEWMRANQPRCMGALFWQFNDAWAGHSWSCIDSAGRKKPLWYSVRRSFAPRVLTIQTFDGTLRLCAVNDRNDAWEADVRVRRMSMDGDVLAEHVERVVALPRAVTRLQSLNALIGEPRDSRAEFIVAEARDGEGERAFWFFHHDRALMLPRPQVACSTERVAGDVHLTLRAEMLLRDIVIAVDRVDPQAEIDDNLFTLLPGEEKTLRIATAVEVPVDRWLAPPVFRSANEFAT